MDNQATDKSVSQVSISTTPEQPPLSAPVKYPDQKDLEVKLVRVDIVNRLEENNSDLLWWQSTLFAFIGGIFGVIVNWATIGTPTFSMASIIIILVFIITAVIIGFYVHKLQNRIAKEKEKLKLVKG